MKPPKNPQTPWSTLPRRPACQQYLPRALLNAPRRLLEPSFIKQYLNASNAGEVETLKTELEKVRVEKDALQAELAAVQVPGLR